jgi:pyruvate dehydrogenase E2 component (dihydrolipoamide acetyltransferase)
MEKGFQDHSLSMMRKSISSKMVQSKGPVPHFYVTSEIDMGECLAMKGSLETLGEEIQIGITDFWVRATAIAMKKFPQVNASFLGDKIRFHGSVDIGIAVGLEDGLIVPVLRHCEQNGLRQIALESKTLIERARTRKLNPEEYTGATFSISNLGMVDVEQFVAIITPPESAALALGSIREVPTVKNGKIEVASRMKATLSCDHRVIDGLQAAQFLKECKKILEHPVLLTV